jgi:hypothetical protein
MRRLDVGAAAPASQLDEAADLLDEVGVGGELHRVDARFAERIAQQRFALRRSGREALAELRIVGVDEELLARLRVAEQEQPQVGKLALQRVVQPHRDDFVAHRQLAEPRRPAGRADEVRDDEHYRAARHGVGAGEQELGELGLSGRGQRRPGLHAVQDLQHLAPAAPRRDHGVDARAVEQRADAVAAAGQQPREQRNELRRHRLLLGFARAEVDRSREVDQEPGRDLAILVELAHVRRLQPRRHVPVDVAYVVAILVLAQVGEVEAEAAEQRPIVALQQAVETAQRRPLQPAKKRFRAAGLGHAPPWASPARAPPA